MKKLFLFNALFVLCLVGCRVKVDYYNNMFLEYSNKESCAARCGKHDSVNIYYDSATKYYNLMYPEGNPVSKKNETICNCK
jgi:hypothetical protein